MDEQRRIVGAVEAQMTRLEAGSADLMAARKRVRCYRTQVLARATASDDGWRVEPLGELLTSLRNGLSHKPEGNDGVPILRISSVRAMSVDLEDIRFLERDKADDAFLVRDGDLLFTRYNGNPELVGVCGRVKGLRTPTLHPDKVIRGRVDEALADPRYLESALNTGGAREHIRRAVKTTAGQAGIAGADLKAAPVPLPPLPLQRRIAEAVNAELAVAIEVDRSLGAAARRVRALNQAVLDAAFSGRLS
jgi:type I restriction enzyme S subunit